MNSLIQKATLDDSVELSNLTFKSKAHWGYSKAQMEKWREDLEVSKEYIRNNEVFLVKDGSQIAGYYSYSKVSDSTVKLDNIFIHPDHIGRGLGSMLMNDFIARINKLQVATITLDAEPHAEQFYERFGFKSIAQLKSSIPNRYLPVMELKLND